MVYSRHSHTEDAVVIKDEQRFWKRILIVDDDEDITSAFKLGIEDSNSDTILNNINSLTIFPKQIFGYI